jgi:4-amino-4-deoxy-L-arabinose transferase-like glycosyltransferase
LSLRPVTLHTAAAALIVFVALALRVWGIGARIPYALEVDEPEIMVRAVDMMKSGDPNPHFFDYPGLVIYLQCGVAAARFLAGAVRGEWTSLAAVGPESFYLWARCLTALFGAATVLLVYLAGRRWGEPAALLAAGLLAVMPLHVRESHFVLADVPMTFFAALTLLLSLRADERRTLGRFCLAGMAAGLTIGAKYNGGVVLFLPLAAAFLGPRGDRPRATLAAAALASAAGAFLVVAPFTVLDLPHFLEAFGFLAESYRPRPPDVEPGWLIYFKHLRNGMGWPALVAALAGLAMAAGAAVVRRDRVRWLLALLTPVTYYWSIADRGLILGRYLLPLLPGVCLLAGIAAAAAAASLLRLSPSRRAAVAGLLVGVAILVWGPARQSFGFAYEFARDSTHALMYRWIQANVPAGGHVVIESHGFRLLPPYRGGNVLSLAERTPDEYVQAGVDFVIATPDRYQAALAEREPLSEHARRYRAIFDRFELVYDVRPDATHAGAVYRIYRVR